MKKKTNLALALMLFLLPVVSFAQITGLTVTGTSTAFGGATIKSGLPIDNPRITFTVSNLSHPVQMSSVVNVVLMKLNSNGGISAFTSLAADVVPNGASAMSWDFQLGNSQIFTSGIIPAATGGLTTFDRKDGKYQFRGDYLDANNVPHQFFSSSFNLIEGVVPRVRITDANESVSFSTNKTKHNVLKGCTNNDPRVRVDPNTYGNDDFRIIAVEYDMATSQFIGTPVNYILSPTEVGDLLSGAGFPLNGFGVGSNTLTLSTNKYYHITVVYQGQGTWKPSYNIMHYKAGTWDLIMRDNASDNGFEPLDIYDHDIFDSQDLWNKLSTTTNQSSIETEAPDFVTIASNTNKLMVNVTNVGCSTSVANVPLYLYWTRARFRELWSKHWKYDLVNNDVVEPVTFISRPAGCEITLNTPSFNDPYDGAHLPNHSKAYDLPAILSGASFQIPFNAIGGNAGGVDWYPPNPAWYKESLPVSQFYNGHPVICLLARIDAPGTDPILYEPSGNTTPITDYVKNNNNVITRNTYVVDNSSFLVGNTNNWDYGFGTVMVNNDDPTPTTVNICVDILPVATTSGTFNTYGSIELGTTTALYNAWVAGGSQSTNINVVSPELFVITNGTHACLENIEVLPGSTEQAGLRFNYNANTLPSTSVQYRYQFSQNSGTETAPVYGSNSIFIAGVPTETPTFPVAKPTTVEGVTVDNHLKVFPNPTNSYLEVQLDNSNFKVGMIEVFDIYGKLVLSEKIKVETPTIRLDVTSLSSGVYMLNTVDVNGIKRNTKIIKQ